MLTAYHAAFLGVKAYNGMVGLPVTYLICALLLAVAGWLLWREIELYRERKTEDSDLFTYSFRRVLWRGLGIVALVAFTVTLALWEGRPPRTAQSASYFMGAFAVELVAMVLVPILDLIETRQTAAGEERSEVMKRWRDRR